MSKAKTAEDLQPGEAIGERLGFFTSVPPGCARVHAAPPGGARVQFVTRSPSLARLGYGEFMGNRRFITRVECREGGELVTMTAEGRRVVREFVCIGYPWEGPPPADSVEAGD